MSAYPPIPSAPDNRRALCFPLPQGREFTIPAYIPVAIIVIVLVVLGYDVSAAVTAVVAMGAAARELPHTA